MAKLRGLYGRRSSSEHAGRPGHSGRSGSGGPGRLARLLARIPGHDRRWFPYLVVLPLGVAIILGILFAVGIGGGGEGQTLESTRHVHSDGTVHMHYRYADRTSFTNLTLQYPVEDAMRNILDDLGPDGAVPALAIRARLIDALGNPVAPSLSDAPDPALQALLGPWDAYVPFPFLVFARSWTRPGDVVVSTAFYPSFDLPAAEAAFAALRAALPEALSVAFFANGGAAERLLAFEALDPPAIGDDVLMYRIRTETTPTDGSAPQSYDSTVIWARIGATILYATEMTSDGPISNSQPALSRAEAGVDLPLTDLAAGAADRIRGFDRTPYLQAEQDSLQLFEGIAP